MATLLQQTEWKTGPRHDDTIYFSTVDDGPVTNVYTGKAEPDYVHLVTSVPVTALTPSAAIGIAGPASTVAGDLGGVIPTGTSLTYGFTGPNIGTFGGSLPQNGPLTTAADWAVQLAAGLNTKHGDVITAVAVITNDLAASVEVVANDASNVTLTSWSI